MNKTGAAYLAASFLTSQSVDAIAEDYIAWIDEQVTAETAINSLLAASRSSKNPDTVLVQADEYYAQFENDPPTITSFTPATGSTAGGTSVAAVGTNLTGITSISVGGANATSVVVVDDEHVTFVTPAGTAGAKNVIVTTPAGAVTKTAAFTYTA